jgi:cytochrome c
MSKSQALAPYLCAILAAAASWSCVAAEANADAAAQLAAREMATAEIHVGKVLFKRKCAKCHSVEESVNEVGPSLYRVVERQAGTAPGYSYSGAIRTSGLVWTEDNLTKYVNDPRAYIPCKPIRIRAVTMCPGIHMKFQGFKNIYAAKAVVAYLKSVAEQSTHLSTQPSPTPPGYQP